MSPTYNHDTINVHHFVLLVVTFVAHPHFSKMCKALRKGQKSYSKTALNPQLSVGQLCDLQSGLMHVSSRTAICGRSTVVDDTTALG